MSDENRINQLSVAKSDVEFVPVQSNVYTVPLWVKILIAGGVTTTGGLAAMLPPPWSIVMGGASFFLGGVAAWLGMTVGVPRR